MVKFAREPTGAMLTDFLGRPFPAGHDNVEEDMRMISALCSIASSYLPFKDKAVAAMRERDPDLDTVDACDLVDQMVKERYKPRRRRR